MDRKYSNEGLPGVLGNKGKWPILTGEQGNKVKISKGTREHGNTALEGEPFIQ